jgi:hypothetical protein
VSRACRSLSFEDAFQLVVFRSHSDFLPLQLVKALLEFWLCQYFPWLSCFKCILSPRLSMTRKLVCTNTNSSICFMDNLFIFLVWIWSHIDGFLSQIETIQSYEKTSKTTFCNLSTCLPNFSHHEMGHNIGSRSKLASLLKYISLYRNCNKIHLWLNFDQHVFLIVTI